MKEVILKLLDWPFLLFGSLIFLAIFFKKHVAGLLNRGDIHISWGEGKSIRLIDLSDNIDKELTPLNERIDLLEMRLTELQGIRASALDNTSKEIGLSDEDKEESLNNMLQALESRKWTWRTIDRLALAGRVTANQARELLLDRTDVVFGQNKEGQTLVKLRNR